MIFLPSIFFFGGSIARFIVIPVNKLDNMISEDNAALNIKDRGICVTVKLTGYKLVLRVGHIVLQGAL